METLIYIFIFIIVFFGILSIAYLVYYNQMKNYLMRINEAELIIDDSLRQRYDLIISAINIIEDVVKINFELFLEIKNIRKKNISSFEFDRKTNETVNLIKQIKKDYQDIDSNSDIKEIFNKLKNCEEKIDAAKEFYNKYTTNLNNLINKFPSNIISKIHNIKHKNYFDNKNLVDDIINDFKI